MVKGERQRASFELGPMPRTCDASDNGSPRASTSSLDDDLNYSPLPRARGAENPTDYSLEEERVVVRKLDRHLVLFLALLYMLSFLDRSSASAVSFPLQDMSKCAKPLRYW